MRIRFDRGTLVLEAEREGEAPEVVAGAVRDDELHAWRLPAERHAALTGELTAAGVALSDELRGRNTAVTWSLPALRWYQETALARWLAAGARGVVALPTEAGKTLVAVAAIARLGVAALCLVPTRVLLDQWARALGALSSQPIGRLGDGDHVVAPVTVATYASTTAWLPRIGDRERAVGRDGDRGRGLLVDLVGAALCRAARRCELRVDGALRIDPPLLGGRDGRVARVVPGGCRGVARDDAVVLRPVAGEIGERQRPRWRSDDELAGGSGRLRGGERCRSWHGGRRIRLEAAHHLHREREPTQRVEVGRLRDEDADDGLPVHAHGDRRDADLDTSDVPSAIR